MSFNLIPSDMILYIITFDLRNLADWINCMTVCKNWKNLLTTNTYIFDSVTLRIRPEMLIKFLRVPVLKKVRSLKIKSGAPLTNQDIHDLYALTSLRSLEIQLCNLTDQGLRDLGALTSLQSLHISLHISNSSQATDHVVQELCALTSLQSLDLSGCHLVTDRGVRALSASKSLESLNFENCYKVTDNGIYSLRNLTTLRSLDLQGCNEVTDECVRMLRVSKSLRSLIAPDEGYY
jgi:hypothetical protein